MKKNPIVSMTRPCTPLMNTSPSANKLAIVTIARRTP